METIDNANSSPDQADKLIPEWRADRDDQIVAVGLAVLLLLLVSWFGWSRWRGDSDDGSLLSALPGAEEAAEVVDPEGDGIVPAVDLVTTTTTVEEEVTTTTTTTTAAPTSTTEAAPVIGDVQAAVSPLPGAITGTNDGATALLTGFVANQGESDDAEDAALGVEGIEAVQNELVLLEPPAAALLAESGVENAGVAGVGTTLTLTGTVASEDARAAVVAWVGEIEGVDEVIDQLTVVPAVEFDLADLPIIFFDTSVSQITAESMADLDAIAQIVADQEINLRVDGWADVAGDAAANQTLSQNRAETVATYLIGQGVPTELLTVIGNGETDQFSGRDDEGSLAANRVVTLTAVE